MFALQCSGIGCSILFYFPLAGNAPAQCDAETEFKCDNQQCVSIRYVCDDVDDCEDGSDEGCRGECHCAAHHLLPLSLY